MTTQDMQFWMMVSLIIIAISFLVMATAVIVLAIMSRKAINTIDRLDEMLQPILTKADKIGNQGEKISVQFAEISDNLSTATQYFSDSAGLIKEEVAEIKQLVGMTANEAKDKVALVSNTIDQTQMQVVNTTQFIQAKVVEPAREIAAIMAGVRKGLEVLFAPSPKQIDRAYQEDEMFIG